MKKFIDYAFWIFLMIAGVYFLYQKGYIFADFEQITPKEAYEMIQKDKNLTILDVRSKDEYIHDGHIRKAVLIPLQQLKENILKLKPYKDSKILIYCRSGHRSLVASRILSSKGYYVINMKNGINGYKKENLPIE